MKNIFSIFLYLFIYLFLLLRVFVVSSSTLEIEDLKKGVVKITATVAGSKKVGTGCIVQLKANAIYIVTASHVVEGSSKVDVEFFTQRNRIIPAKVIAMEGGDPTGLAVLLIEDKVSFDISVLELSGSIPGRAGDPVTTIGFPRISDVPWAVINGGIVGSTGRTITFSGSVDEGNSGGPLFKEGKIVGIITQVKGQFAYAIPTLIAQYILKSWGVLDEEISYPSVGKPSPPLSYPPSTNGTKSKNVGPAVITMKKIIVSKGQVMVALNFFNTLDKQLMLAIPWSSGTENDPKLMDENGNIFKYESGIPKHRLYYDKLRAGEWLTLTPESNNDVNLNFYFRPWNIDIKDVGTSFSFSLKFTIYDPADKSALDYDVSFTDVNAQTPK